MNSKFLFKILKPHWSSKLFRPSVYFPHGSKSYATESPQAELLVAKEKIQITKPVVTQWKRPPFVKDLFYGKFDVELLSFPEILSNELLLEVEKYVKYLNDIYVNKVNSKQIAETGKIPQDLLQDLKDIGLFGRMIPAEYGGLDLSYTACTRLNEVIGLDWSIYSMLTVHECFASQVILQFGTKEQKDKYLPLLASGKLIAAFCMAEFKSGSDLLSISTSANRNVDDTFSLNGVKSWVSNGDIADIYIVFANTMNPVDPKQQDISVFIVERKTPGITTLPQEKTYLSGLNTCIVKFEDVFVPAQNLVGELARGYEIYLKALESFRIGMNSFTFGALKFLLDSVTDKIINTDRIEKSLGDAQLVRIRLSKVAGVIYAMESLAYFTAAILDSTENPDVSLESAILKIFNTEGTLYCLKELIDLAGSSSLMKDNILQRFYNDALALQMFDGPNDIAKLYVGLMGCKYVGAKKADLILKGRNLAFFPIDGFKMTIRKTRHLIGKVKFDQDLAGHIHPSLVKCGNDLEEKLQKFQVAVEHVLMAHGQLVVETQINPKDLATCAAYLYAQAAVISRSSRSYCIGLKNSHHEVRLTAAFCSDADKLLYDILRNIFRGPNYNNDGEWLDVGAQVIDCRGYFPEHPLKHNF